MVILSKNFANQFSFHIGETERSALEIIREFLMIKAHQMEDCRMDIMDRNLVFYSLETKIIGLAMTLVSWSSIPWKPKSSVLP